MLHRYLFVAALHFFVFYVIFLLGTTCCVAFYYLLQFCNNNINYKHVSGIETSYVILSQTSIVEI